MQWNKSAEWASCDTTREKKILKVSHQVSFLSSGLNHAVTIAVLYSMTCYIGLCYHGTQLYLVFLKLTPAIGWAEPYYTIKCHWSHIILELTVSHIVWCSVLRRSETFETADPAGSGDFLEVRLDMELSQQGDIFNTSKLSRDSLRFLLVILKDIIRSTKVIQNLWNLEILGSKYV